MPDFKVVSDFQPTGDQPAAIAQLIEGLGKGYKKQTLLGATATGKSLGYDELVYVVEKRNGQPTPRIVSIGEFIDRYMESAEASLRHEGETTILDVSQSSDELAVLAMDPDTGCVELASVGSLTRHRAPAQMFRIQTACGRKATLTGDHNLWVLRDGSLSLIKTSEARPTDRVPLPESLPTNGEVDSLNTLSLLSSERLFVAANGALRAYVENHGAGSIVQALDDSGISGYHKLYAVQHGTRGSGIAVDTFTQVLNKTGNLDGQWDAKAARVGGKKDHNSLPAQLDISPELMRLMGYYIAEGNHQATYLVLASRDEVVRADFETALQQFGIPFSVRPSSDYQVSSQALSKLLARHCGTNARDKHLPEFWPQLPKAALAQLLTAYFDGDGTVNRANAVSAMTASARLASDLAYALLEFGIWARVNRRWKRATNSQHAGDWYYQVTISGQADLRRFYESLGFRVSRKQKALTAKLIGRAHSNVDLVPISGKQLRWLRQAVEITATALASAAGCTRSAVEMIENDKRSPMRSTLLKILRALDLTARDRGELPADWRQVWASLQKLCGVRWTRIASVTPVDYTRPFVYDFSVPGPETFLAGTGGFFVHNTFVMAKIIESTNRPTLIMAHNKTLAAQLYSEFKEFFPHNAVEYFVSYYDYYQPEAYLPRTDTYIEKDSDINEEIDRLRLAATSSLLSRRDVIIVASVSCIYGLGDPAEYGRVTVKLERGGHVRRDQVLRELVDTFYERNDMELRRGKFRVRGDTLEVMPAYADLAYRIEFFGDEVDRITEVDALTGEVLKQHNEIEIFPAKHFITPQDKLNQAIIDIEAELEAQLKTFREQGKLLEAQRLEQRTRYDLEMLREVGYCSGIENYSRPLSLRPAGSRPWTLLDYFPADWLMIMDESHMTVPQVRGMFNGDRARKEVLVDYGFRLPSALDNRPLRFDEFEATLNDVIFTSATPGPYELQNSSQVVEQIIRPTGLIDPQVEIRPTKGQVDDLVGEIRKRVANGERVLVTTLTKRMAEDLADYLQELGIRVHYLHSEVQTLERVEILRDLRLGVYDVIVGINLLREGLDLPEVSLVAILDADKEGFLRSEQSLIQTIGRAARHLHGTAIMYADQVTDSMKRAIEETNRRRQKQETYNTAHGITPVSIVKSVRDLTQRIGASTGGPAAADGAAHDGDRPRPTALPKDEATRLIKDLEKQMKTAAQDLEFEKAAALRDQIIEIRQMLSLQDNRPIWEQLRDNG